MKKRFISAILAICLIIGMCPTGGFAAETAPATGELCLTLHRAGAVAAAAYTVTLKDSSGTAVKSDYANAAYGDARVTAALTGIDDGDYTLTVTAPGALPYEQALTFDGRCVNLELYNYASVNDGRTGTDGLFGTMPAGDVNGDGVINDADADAITAHMGGSGIYDLTGDGKVDLTDLTVAVRNAAPVTLAPVVHTVSSAVLQQAVAVTAPAGTETTGDLNTLLDQQDDTNGVALSPASGAAISESSPVSVELAVAGSAVRAEAVVIAPPAQSESYPTAGVFTVEGSDEEGNVITFRGELGIPGGTDRILSSDQPAEISTDSDGAIVINLGKRVAIKKVTIRVTATADQGNLAEIAKVEFLSDFAERIAEPELSVPTVLSVSNTETDGQGYKNLTVTWNPQTNVTGYEVSVSGPGYNKTASTPATAYTFMGDSFNGTVKSFATYAVKVRSVNGDWRSDWSEVYSHTVTCKKAPPAPQYVNAAAGVQCLRVSWNCKYDAETFTLYYKAADAEAYEKIENLTASSYTISNLQGGVKYNVYVVAHNRNGSSPRSDIAEGMPTNPTGVQMPKYRLINVNDEEDKALTHIQSIYGTGRTYTIYRPDGTTVDQSTATPKDWEALLDNDPNSYLLIPDWDSGVVYANFRGPIIRLDKPYTMDTFRLSQSQASGVSLYQVTIGYKDETGASRTVGTNLSTRYDSQNRKYYELTLSEPITTDYLEIRTRTMTGRDYTICEVKLYEYDDIEATVANLFADSIRTVLKEEVTEETVQALIDRVNTPDPVSGELHPHKSAILTDLLYALQLLRDGAALDQLLTVENDITANGNPNNGFAQALSDYQPLGRVAAAGDTLVIYVVDNDQRTARGSNVNLKLVATQFHPEVTAWQSGAIQLKSGRNEITIPRVGSYAKEAGGSLYLQYTGTKGGNHYQVRVSGGTKIPTLRLDGVTGDARTAAIREYIAELDSYVAGLTQAHAQLHTGSDNANVNYDYSAAECFLNSTEITLENMMYSVPATQVRAALGTGDRAGRLANAIAAMEQEIDYFYQFRGLHREAVGNDAYPYTRLNIRYHQMFTGAFMYAGGKHIGLEFGSVGALFGLTPVTTDANGKKLSGNLSGWAISHEIGHCINASAYQRVEVTNNMFAQLAKTDETNATFRTGYDKVYKAVATGTTGHTGDLAVQLAMYWQLHLAYDNDYTFKLYDTVEAQMNGLFYARLDSYLRDRTKAEPDLPTGTSGDQLFMQAACAAANRDILDFFRAWGFYPDATTVAYASRFEKETRKIQYIDDNSRLYRLEKKAGMSAGTKVTAAVTNAVDRRVNGSRVTISLANNNTNPNAMLGYEIRRNGKVVAFVTGDKTSYTDIVTTENNKAFVYTVTGIDRLLKETTPVELPEVKICHDGAIGKDGWTAATNMSSWKDTVAEKDDEDPETGPVNGNTKPGVEIISAIPAAFDNDPSTVYFGTSNGSNNRPYVILNLGGMEQVTALKFTPAPEGYTGDASNTVNAGDLFKYRLFGYRVEISTDGNTWTTVKEGNSYTGSAGNPGSWVKQNDIIYNADGSYTMFFNKKLPDGTMDPFMYTYDAAYVKVTATNMSALAIAEMDILGPTGDNVELIPAGFGRLAEEYNAGSYADGSSCVIPKGAIVFYGAYKGDPAYNVVLLKDQNGKVIDGSQLIFAEVPEKGALGQTSDGRWFYWLEDKVKTDDNGDTYNEMDQLAGLKNVQAELYRVQDAMTLAGFRLTSTSLHMDIPATIPSIRITAEGGSGVVYVPTADMVRGARTAETVEISANTQPDTVTLAVGNTGAAADDASLVQITADGTGFTVVTDPASIAAAAQVDLALTPAGSAEVILNREPGIYQSWCYVNEKLSVFMVSRSGALGEDKTVAFRVEELNRDCVLTAAAITEVDGTYTNRVTALDASAEFVYDCRHGSTENVYQAPTCTEPGYDRTVCALCGAVLAETVLAPTGHHYMPVTTAPTCEKDGYTTYTCTVCGDSYMRDLVPATGHSWSDTVIAPTCVAQGYTTHVCTVCGETYTDRVVPATGHSYTAVVTPPTCDAMGYTTHTCTVCGESYRDSYVAATEHNYTNRVTKAPTCTAEGEMTFTCADCGKTYTQPIPKTEHNYKPTVTAPTCGANGYTTYTCADCGVSYISDIVAPLGHDYTSRVVEPTCLGYGYTELTCKRCGDSKITAIVQPKGHSYTDKVTAPTCTAGGYTTHTCGECGFTFVDSITAPTGHDWAVKEVAPACEHDGYTQRTCTKCGDTQIVGIIRSQGHEYTATVTPPTCDTVGYTTHTCKNCGHSYVDTLVPATEHNYTNRVTKPATCTAEGEMTFTCADCGKTYTQPIAKTAHDYTDSVVAPGCETPGYTKRVCTVCGDEIYTRFVAALGHDYTERVVAPTCLGYGFTELTCKRCNDGKIVSIVQPKGHTYKETVVEPTCTTPGCTVYTCADCGHSYMDGAIAPKGHSFTDKVTAPTCVDAGYTTHTCAVCGFAYADTLVPAKGHHYEGTVTREPTCTAEGEKTYKCTVCGESCTQPIPKAEHSFEIKVVDPTCVKAGYTAHICTVCGYNYVTDVTAPKGHDYVGEVTKEATCTAEGIMTYKCTVCGESYTKSIAKLDHDFCKDEVQATCTKPGWLVHTCGVCGYSYITDVTPAKGHDYKSEVTKEATCTETGVRTYTCTVCGETYTEALAKIDHDHTVEVFAPTCTRDGYTLHTCVICGDSIITDVLPAMGHTYVDTVTAPTCERQGYTTHICTECADLYMDHIQAATGHRYESVITAPTCEKQGYTTHTCAVCGDRYVDSIVDAAGHSYKTVVTEATCEAMGFTTHTCTVCGVGYTDDYVPAIDHNYTQRVTKPATCAAEGELTFTCADCGKSYTQPIAKAEHSYQAATTAPVCEKQGYTTYTCTVCGDSYRADFTESLGHDVAERIVAPTCEGCGYHESTCKRCGLTYITMVEEAKGHTPVRTGEKPATGTEEGYTGDRICSVCGKVLETGETIPVNADLYPSKAFNDVKQDAWYRSAVDYALANGLMTGVSANKFDPNGKITRGQLVTILYRMAGSPEVEGASTFTDVPAGKYYTKAVIWASGNGVVNGVTATTFAPDKNVTREQLVVMLYRFAKFQGKDLGEPDVTLLDAFADGGKVGSFAREAMAWAIENGILSGEETAKGTYLRGSNTATRAQIAAILMRYLKDGE